jgi:predicted phosphate transport protein (TIGR00153 family)
MLKKFLPKQDKFFKLLSELAENILTATELLHEMFGNLNLLAELATQIHIIENKCDEFTHTIINELNETFLTPIDREDIYMLANALDDIVDSIDTIATRLNIYNIKHPSGFGPQLSEILLSQMKLIVEIIEKLQDHKVSMQKIIAIRNLETEGDEVFREALLQLFKKQKDAIELIKEKEILEIIEKAVDRCQHTTLVMESILIKQV